jgi:hypothetical protein
MIDNNDDANIDDNNKKVVEGSVTDAEEEDAPTIWYVDSNEARALQLLLLLLLSVGCVSVYLTPSPSPSSSFLYPQYPDDRYRKKYAEYHVKVDPDQDDKATEIRICQFKRPHMRYVHPAYLHASLSTCQLIGQLIVAPTN